MRPDFKEINERAEDLLKFDGMLQNMFSQTQQLKEATTELCYEQQKRQAVAQLRDIPVDELKESRAGIRTSVLLEAGYQTLYDLSLAGDDELSTLSGVGEKQVAAIRTIIDGFTGQLASRERIRLPKGISAAPSRSKQEEDELSGQREDAQERLGCAADGEDAGGVAIVCSLARCRRAQEVTRDAKELCDQIHAFVPETVGRLRIRNRVHWLFSLASTKEETLQADQALRDFSRSTDYERARRFLALFWEAVSIDEAGALADYEKNSASYYAMLEKITGTGIPEELIYGSVPASLASTIRRTELDLQQFRGELRGYQQFGAQYILRQKRVLLGDEMGLGKTVQAIAVMAHMNSSAAGGRFLVVCPASVLINWCREIRKFSSIEAHLIHGSGRENAFANWKRNGGAAVTNYESLKHIVDGIDGQMKLDLLVIDEAHYIKNPDARRTKYIHRLEDEAERILMMTGTPLENKVDEMCELIGFLRPDLVPEIRAYAGMRRVAAFREILSPVYLRRQVRQVLDELPELIEKEEWCSLTEADREAYIKEVIGGSFMSMRRVSFLQDDLSCSAKAVRLLELCEQAREEGKKIVIYSWFRETLRKVEACVRDFCIGEISGSTDPAKRQSLIDCFAQAPGGSALLCQIQAGGTGLNMQMANVVIFCEPQIKPSLERQAVSRAYRMGQIRNVLVYHLLCENSIDESVQRILEEKEKDFLLYADESAMAEAEAQLADQEWIRNVVEQERRRYLPAVI